MVGFCDDNMVAQGNAEQLAGRRELLSKGNIFGTGARIARRVVVGDDDRCGAVDDGIAKNLARMGEDAVERADGDRALGNESLAAVER